LTKGHVHTNKEDDAATESCESSDESASSNHDYTPQFRGTCTRKPPKFVLRGTFPDFPTYQALEWGNRASKDSV
jgi:hypothetical protein